MIYAPLAPLVAIGACLVFWFSSIVVRIVYSRCWAYGLMQVEQYKYQLLYVYVSRAESGGRMWNVYVNRLLACCVLMQLLMILSRPSCFDWYFAYDRSHRLDPTTLAR